MRGSTSDSARRRSSAKSTSVQGSPVTSTQPTGTRARRRCSASSYSLVPPVSSMDSPSRRMYSGACAAPHLKKPIPSPTTSHRFGHELLAEGDDAIAHAVELDLLAGVGEAAVEEERAPRGGGDEAGEERVGEEHVGVHHEGRVAGEGVAGAPQREDGALLIVGVLDVGDPHRIAATARGGPYLILAMADHQHRLLDVVGGERREHPVEEVAPADGEQALVRVIGERRQAPRDSGGEDYRPHRRASTPAPARAPRNRSRISSGG